MNIDVELTDLAYGGDAVGRYEGRVLFVPGGIPGERVRVEIVEERRGHARASLLEILRPAPERIEPPYPLLIDSGCQWEHIAYPAQLAWKAHIVRQLLVRIGRQPDAVVYPTLGMPRSLSPWHYRNIALFSVGPDGEIGLKLTDSHDIQDLESYALLHPALDVIYQGVRRKLTEYFGESLGEMLQGFTLRGAVGAVGPANGEEIKEIPALLIIHARPGSFIEEPQRLAQEIQAVARSIVGVIVERVGVRYGRVVEGQEYLTDKVLGCTFRVSADSFFQVNLTQTETLIEKAIQMIDPRPNEIALDGYSGVGLFSAFLASRAQRVIAIESQPCAVMDARANALLNNQQNKILAYEGTLERVLSQISYRREHIDIALIDPPRTGCHPKAIQALRMIGPRHICYVSCDPSTLARDIAALCGDDRYRLIATQPVDMFPQTYHIESVSLLARSGMR